MAEGEPVEQERLVLNLHSADLSWGDAGVSGDPMGPGADILTGGEDSRDVVHVFPGFPIFLTCTHTCVYHRSGEFR